MSNLYARSTDGSNSDTGLTWALAKADIGGASGLLATMAAGDVGYVSQASAAESYASAKTLTLPGTMANPCMLIAGNDGAEPPTADSGTKVQIKTTGASSLTLQCNEAGVWRGFEFTCGNGFNFANFTISGLGSSGKQRAHYQICDFIFADTHPSSSMAIGQGAAGTSDHLSLEGCRIKLPSGGQPVGTAGTIHINGGNFISGTGTPATGLFTVGQYSRDGDLLVENFDFTALATTLIPFNPLTTLNLARALIRNSKFPASWNATAIIGQAIPGPGWAAELRNVSYGSNFIRLWGEYYQGVIRDESNAARTGGAADAVGGYSLKMTTNANANEISPLPLLEMDFDNTAVGSSKTATVEFIHDSATALTNAEVWAEVHSLNTSGSAQGSSVSNQRATPMTTAASQATSTATWTGSVVSGMSNANKQKLAVTFTPQIAGRYVFKVFLGKTSKTIYVDPSVTVA